MKTKQITFLAALVFICTLAFSQQNAELYKPLQKYTGMVISDFTSISEERKKELKEIGDFVIEKRLAGTTCNLLFICTSNSRRSHMAQIWSQTAAIYYGLDSVFTFSGGTEATRVHPNTIATLRRAGFSISTTQSSDNPVWFVAMGSKLGQWGIFSKKYDASVNPKKGFCAVMVCSEADKSCPAVDGADMRIAMPYEDPKYYDNTPSKDLKYDERCKQIATEQFFTMDYVKQKLILKQESRK